jgi:hypothetical protein
MSEWRWFAATPPGNASAPAKQTNTVTVARFAIASPFQAGGREDGR